MLSREGDVGEFGVDAIPNMPGERGGRGLVRFRHRAGLSGIR